MERPLDRAYVTRDGSSVVELLHPEHGGPEAYSVALAVVSAGECTRLHHHKTSREVYHFAEGEATVEVGKRRVSVAAGDTVTIPAAVDHRILAGERGDVHLVCICRPPYRHDDTVVVGDAGDGDR
jgi:mannose-6-phosphate isomerase-like protein (cupin superfamily)